MKIVEVQEGFPYWETERKFSDSLIDTRALLERFGCDRIVTDEQKVKIPPKGEDVTVYRLMFQVHNLPYVIEYPVTFRKFKRKPRKLDMRLSGRIIFNLVKSLLVNAQIDYLSFEQAMVMFTALPGPKGEAEPLMEVVHRDPRLFERLALPEYVPDRPVASRVIYQ